MLRAQLSRGPSHDSRSRSRNYLVLYMGYLPSSNSHPPQRITLVKMLASCNAPRSQVTNIPGLAPSHPASHRSINSSPQSENQSSRGRSALLPTCHATHTDAAQLTHDTARFHGLTSRQTRDTCPSRTPTHLNAETPRLPPLRRRIRHLTGEINRAETEQRRSLVRRVP